MVLYLYKFAKKENSTLSTETPDVFIERSIGVLGALVKNSSILYPTIEISQEFSDTATTNPNTPITEFNYAKIEDFNRFYFIENWTFSGDGFWTATMRVDVLATYKEEIGLSVQYVLRSASRGNNAITDSIHAITTDYDLTIDYPKPATEELYHAWGHNKPEDYYRYCLGVLNSDGGDFGAVSYYTMTRATLKQVLSYLMGSTDWLDVGEIGAGLLKSLFNPLQYIVSCKMFPCDFESFYNLSGVVTEKIKFGWWTLPVYARKLVKPAIVHLPQFSFNIHSHPEVFGIDGYSYFNREPYTTRTCYFEPFGKFELPPLPNTATKINVHLDVDMISGRGFLKMCTDESVENIVYREGIVGTDVQLSQMASDIIGVAGGIVQTVGGVVGSAADRDISGAIGSLTSGITSTIDATIPAIDTRGSNSGFLAFRQTPRVETRHYKIVDKDYERYGKPLCRRTQLKNLTGFVMCNAPTIEIERAMLPEIDEIKNFMRGGFYYE